MTSVSERVRKRWPAASSSVAQFAKIVDFAVEDDSERSVFVPDRLAAAGQIDDAEAAHAEGDRRCEQNAFFVGAAMNDGGHHPAHDGFARFLRFDSDDAADSAHQRPASLKEMRAIAAQSASPIP